MMIVLLKFCFQGWSLVLAFQVNLCGCRCVSVETGEPHGPLVSRLLTF